MISCNNPFEVTEKDIISKEIQISPDSKYAIYNYCIGMGAMGDDICKTKIFEKNQEFNLEDGYDINGQIGEWISNDTLSVYRFDNNLSQPKDTLTKISYEKFKDLTLKIKKHGAINSSILNDYKFKDFKIVNNKIIFNEIEHEFDSDLNKTVQYNLGNITFVEENDSLKSINIYTVTKSMNFTYHNSDGTFTDNLPEIGAKIIRFIPKNKLLIKNIKNTKGVFHTLK